MERRRVGLRALLSCLLIVLSSVIAAPTALADVIRLDRGLSALIADFNAEADKIRLVFIVGPTCPVCRKGLFKMKEDVLSQLPGNSELSIFVVHVPALEAKAEDVPGTFSLFNDQRAQQYWDEMGTSGIRFQRALALPTYAWDVWMIYPANIQWEAKDPPTPDRWWHQLKRVSPEHRLDTVEFLEVLNSLLLDSENLHGDD
jgi:hypothetical protein